MRSRYFFYLSLALIIGYLVFTFFEKMGTQISVQAQSCTEPPHYQRVDAWRQSASVRVNIDPGYNTD